MRPQTPYRFLWPALPLALGCLFGLLGLFIALSSAPARAQSPAPEQLPPIEDAYVSSAHAKDNFGGDGALSVLGGGTDGAEDVTLLKLDLSVLAALPPDADLDSATLVLFQTGAPTPNGAQRIYSLQSNWREDSVTWKNRPKRADGLTPVSFSTGQGVGDFVRVDVTDLIRAWLASNQPGKGFAIVADPAAGAVQRTYASRESDNPPVLEVAYRLPPIRVCQESSDPCAPAAGAEVYDVDSGTVYVADGAGYITRTNTVAVGDRLWVRRSAGAGHEATLYHTGGSPVTVEAKDFRGSPRELRLTVSAAQPLYVRDLTVSAQWYVEGDPALRDHLRSQLLAASDALYAFTEGQFALGTVTVLQSGEGWDDADVHIYASNTLAPKAIVGGSVLTDTPDIAATVQVTYGIGNVSMGWFWNRFRSPPGQVNTVDGQPVPPAELQDDWSLALAHELGHWLLFLFDTYADVDGSPSRALAESCTGSAMGDVYRPINQAFVSDQVHWDTNCSNTEAYARLQGRNEWDTIAAWYPWVVKPDTLAGAQAAAQAAAHSAAIGTDTAALAALPVPLTQIVFAPPATPPGQPASSVYALRYQDGEAASGEARSFLFRDERIFDLGKPPKDGITLTVAGAEVGDRLCVYDVNDYPDNRATPRHQFGCEVLDQADAELVMTKDPTWQPGIVIEQVGPQQIRLNVTQTVAGPPLPLRARLYPENGPLLAEVDLSPVGDGRGAVLGGTDGAVVLDLGRPVPPLFVQVFVNEPDGEPVTRREVVTDRGVGGGGAFGPRRLYGGVMVQSPDGVAAYQKETPVELAEGESIAWQSVASAPAPPTDQQLSGQPYGLDAYPPALADGGEVQIQYTGGGAPGSAQAAGAVHYWNGQEWEKLPTQVTTRVNAVDGVSGEPVARAPSRGVGLYALFLDKDALPPVTPTPTPDPGASPDPGTSPTPTPLPIVTPTPPQAPEMNHQMFLPLIEVQQ